VTGRPRHRSMARPSAAATTSTPPPAWAATRASISASVRAGSWWNSTRARALAWPASPTAYSTAECPKCRRAGNSAAVLLGVVDQEVDVTGQVHGRRVVLAEAVGALADHDRAVVREVGNRRPAVGDAEAEGATALVGDVRRRHLEALEAVLPGLQGDEAPLPAELSGRDREVRRRDGPLEHLLGVTLAGHGDGHLTVGPVAGAEEGEAVRVVPVKVAEQDRPPERPAVQVP
jgi:hypothetical protein